MASEADGSTTAKTYELLCTDCSFEATVQGSFHEALDVAEAHQDDYGKAPADHFVNFQLVGQE